MAKYKKWGICVYCGDYALTTRDHVFPRGLFPEGPKPTNPVTVEACARCNHVKSRGDNDLRDFAALNKDGSRHPVARSLFEGKIARSFRQHNSEILRNIANARILPYYTQNGIFLGNLPHISFDNTNMMRCLQMIARGLYFTYFERRLPPTEKVSIRLMPRETVDEVVRDLFEIRTGPLWRIGENVVWWFPVTSSPDDGRKVSIWVFCFYDQVVFAASIGEVEDDDAAETLQFD